MLSYLDAGSGSMILAAFAGGFAGIAVLGKMYWFRFLGLFSKKYRDAAEETALSVEGSDTEVSDDSAPLGQ